MAIIEFENGQRIEFEGDPSTQDIEFAAKQLGITPSSNTEPTERVVPNPATSPLSALLAGPVGSNIGSDVPQQLVRGPGVDLARGFLQGSQDVVRPGASVLEFLGTPDKFNVLKQAEENAAFLETGIPESITPQPARAISELIGRAPGLTAEFLQGGALLRGAKVPQAISKALPSRAARGLTTSTELATTRALEELREGAPEALEAAKEGFEVGMFFGVAAPIAGKGFSLMKQGLAGAAKKLIEVSTNNLKLASDFIKNPQKYNLRFFDKNVKTVKEAQQANSQIRQTIVDRHKLEMDALRESQRASREELAVKQRDAANLLRDRTDDIKGSVTREGSLNVEDLTSRTQQAVRSHRESFAQKLDSDIGNTISVAERIRQQEGELVGDAIEGIVAIDPKAGIPFNNLMASVRPILQAAQRRGAFKVGSRGKVTAVTSRQTEIVNQVKTFLKDLRRLRIPKEGVKPSKRDVPLEVLQGLKNDAREISQAAFNAKDGTTGRLFADLSTAVNPAKIVSDNPVLSQRMSVLAEANRKFANQIKPYNDLVKLMTTRDANNNVVTNIGTVVSGVKNSNPQIINRLRKIDASLPEADKVLPKIRSHINEVEKAVSRETANLKALKRNVEDSIKRQSERARKLSRNLSKEQRVERFEFTEEQRTTLTQRMRLQQEELRRFDKSITDEINFLEDQNALRAFQGQGLTGLLQRVFAFGEVLPFFTGGGQVGRGVGGLFPIFGLSPNIIGKAFQTGTRLTPRIEAGASSALNLVRQTGTGQLLQRFLADRDRGTQNQ